MNPGPQTPTERRTLLGATSGLAVKIKLLLAILMVLTAVATYTGRFPMETGVDFYHVWGITAASKWHGEQLGSPYRDLKLYEDTLNRTADASRDDHFKVANKRRRAIDPTGTPLFYSMFSFLPRDYSAAHTIFRALQIATFIAGVVICLSLLGYGLLDGLIVGSVFAIHFTPISVDLQVGNVNALQFFAAAVLLMLAVKNISRGEGARLGPAGYAFFFGLAWFVLFKPNYLPLAVLLAIYVWVRRGASAFFKGCAAGLVSTALLVAITSLYFHDGAVWQDWYSYLYGDNKLKLISYPIEKGNFASPVVGAAILERLLGRPTISPYTFSAILGALCLLSVAAILPRRARSWRRPDLLEAARDILCDPYIVASLGVLITLAAAPLGWAHYHLLVLIPAFWLLFVGERWNLWSLVALVSFCLYMGNLYFLLMTLSMKAWGASTTELCMIPLRSFAWLGLWIPMLVSISRPRSPTEHDSQGS